ncbi:MAG: DUF885 domain-containing protein [Gemmatimonadetes bacterium]|nr:DUF885 domain-containing protein [Gemmatimonadota bacterium]
MRHNAPGPFLAAPIGLLIWVVASGCDPAPDEPQERGTRYEDLTALFEEWREFRKPPLVEGVADYSAGAMAAQHSALPTWMARLGAIDPTGWPISQQIDHRLVRAEMNGLDFDHRVLRPWQRDPAFYVTIFPSQSDVPAREGPVAHGAIELWSYAYPLSEEDASRLAAALRAIPPLLAQAKQNLTGNARDLWVYGTRAVRAQSDDLAALSERLAGPNPALLPDIAQAKAATDSLAIWLESEAPSKTGPSGVGEDPYDWYLRNVHLLPYTWQELVTIMRRELARAHASLRLEEHRNRRLPPLEPIASAADYDRLLNEAVTQYMSFLEENEIVSVRDYMDAALRARIGQFSPAAGRREFFSEVNYRDGVVMRTHGYHWFDLARMAREPHRSPVRATPLLYNIFDGRAEGMATGTEEMMMHAGLFDGRPRARELIWILLAQRAARALGDLMMHANLSTLEQASAFASEWTPRGWLPLEGSTVWNEQHLYLQQPGYGTSYVIGKIQIEQLMGERATQLGDAFTLRGFFDEFNAAGVIPVSLIRWELTGKDDEIDALAPAAPAS